MQIAKRKRRPKRGNSTVPRPNGKARSFRELKAFGIWAHRTDVMDPIQFTKALRTRMEQGDDAR